MSEKTEEYLEPRLQEHEFTKPEPNTDWNPACAVITDSLDFRQFYPTEHSKVYRH